MYHPREEEINYLNKFIKKDKDFGLMAVRGKRRTGKSWILKKLNEKHQGIYFTGEMISSHAKTIKRFRKVVKDFCKKNHINISELTESMREWEFWGEIFKDLAIISNKYFYATDKPLLLIIDEVQWIKQDKMPSIASGIKTSEYELNHSRLKVILCGSSQKYFIDHFDDSESELYLMHTYHSLEVKPFNFMDIKKYCFPNWTDMQNAIIFMITGGMPFYLKEIKKQNFSYAVNEAFFISSSILLKELENILSLDFSKKMVPTISSILKIIAPSTTSVTRKTIEDDLEMSQSHINDCISQMLKYKIIEKVKNFKDNSAESFVISDSFILFYFSVFDPAINEIKQNKSANLFEDIFPGDEDSFYIESLSGRAFEILTQKSLVGNYYRNPDHDIYKKLEIDQPIQEKNIYSAKLSNNRQIDILYEESYKFPKTFIFECKWGKEKSEWIEKLLSVQMEGVDAKKILVVSNFPSSWFQKRAKEAFITVLTLNDL